MNISAHVQTAASTPSRQQHSDSGSTHTVKQGDTLFGIARQNQTSVAELKKQNPQLKQLRDTSLPVGMELKLPANQNMEKPATETAAEPAPTRAPASAETVANSRRAAAASERTTSTQRLSALPGSRLEANTLKGQETKRGDQGQAVVDLQRFLGMKTSQQDGVFGPQTERALKSFQESRGLSAHGRVDAATMKALKDAGSTRDQFQDLDMRLATGNPIQAGEKGTYIKALQKILGFKPAEQTGNYDDKTQGAVKNIQSKELGMNESSPGFGQVGQTTMKAIQEHQSAATQTNGVQISQKGREQMSNLINHARAHHQGGSYGDCFKFVWGYMTKSGYGKLDNWNDLPKMNGALARGLPDYLNKSPAHLKEAGLQRLDTATTPPIQNPHDPRIPPGAVIVVAPKSYGTAHATAGDIVVKGNRPGEFINDGPRMDYGTSGSWYGKILGVYVPE